MKMINVSNEFKNRIEDGIFLAYLTITLQDGTVLDITDEDIWDGGFNSVLEAASSISSR